MIGKWLQGKPRDRFVLATKCRMRVGHGPNDEGLSRRHIFKAVDDTLWGRTDSGHCMVH